MCPSPPSLSFVSDLTGVGAQKKMKNEILRFERLADVESIRLFFFFFLP